MSVHPPARLAVAAILVIGAVLAGCAPVAPSASPPASATATPSGAPAASASGGPPPSMAGIDAPPEATLTVEGGDPIRGQLGTYRWGEGGSDAPLLPGTRVAVGAGEPMRIAFEPPGDVGAWTLRVRPVDATGAVGAAVDLASGQGDPAARAPGPGIWSLELEVAFLGDLGSAHVFWRLEIP